MKVFISQPMRGLSDDEIVEKRDKAYKRIMAQHGEDVEVIESYKPFEFEALTPLESIGESLKMMSDADIVYFLPGWESARGCAIEHAAAVMYHIPLCEL